MSKVTSTPLSNWEPPPWCSSLLHFGDKGPHTLASQAPLSSFQLAFFPLSHQLSLFLQHSLTQQLTGLIIPGCLDWLLPSLFTRPFLHDSFNTELSNLFCASLSLLEGPSALKGERALHSTSNDTDPTSPWRHCGTDVTLTPCTYKETKVWKNHPPYPREYRKWAVELRAKPCRQSATKSEPCLFMILPPPNPAEESAMRNTGGRVLTLASTADGQTGPNSEERTGQLNRDRTLRPGISKGPSEFISRIQQSVLRKEPQMKPWRLNHKVH